MFISEIFRQKGFVITAELTPPRGTDVNFFLEQAQRLHPVTDAINVTDNPRAAMKLSPLAAARLLVEQGITPVLQYTCRDRNRLALQSDLLAASVFGVDNLLLVTGDYPGDCSAGSKSVFDLDSVQLLKTAALLAKGQDLTGRRLQGKAVFCTGAVVNPNITPRWPQLWKMIKKTEAGANFFQTQAIFEEGRFNSFMSCIGVERPLVLAGILLIESGAQLRFLREKVPGIVIPSGLIEQVERFRDQAKAGANYLIQLVEKIRPYCQGIHLMAPGMEKAIPDFIRQLSIPAVSLSNNDSEVAHHVSNQSEGLDNFIDKVARNDERVT
jgi:5,10-methylenetetrahydrofolate reductase